MSKEKKLVIIKNNFYIFKKICFLLIVFFILFLNILYSKDSKNFLNKNEILVSILPIKGVLSNILGKNIKYYNIEVILKVGMGHHTTDISPVLIKKLNSFNYILSFNSLEIEKILLTKANKDKLINLYDGDYILNDPHVWLSLKNLKKIYSNAYNLIYNIDKSNYKYYKSNLDKILAKIELYDNLFKNKFKNSKDKYILTYHNEYYYFARDYNLKIISYEYNETEASLRDIQKIVKLINDDKILFILTTPYYNNAVFEKLLSKTKKRIKIVKVDSFNEDTLQVFWQIYSFQFLK
ncbi:MAG: metal ABC transporter substrate-binding protein [bacterium]